MTSCHLPVRLVEEGKGKENDKDKRPLRLLPARTGTAMETTLVLRMPVADEKPSSATALPTMMINPILPDDENRRINTYSNNSTSDGEMGL